MRVLTVSEIAKLCDGQLAGSGDREISGANTLEDASEQELGFVATPLSRKTALQSRAGCLLTPEDFNERGAWSVVKVADPRKAFALVLRTLAPRRKPASYRHSTAVVAETAKIGLNVYIGAFVTVGENTVIADGVYLANHVSVGDNVRIGECTEARAHVTIYDGVQIGARVLLHSGCVLGADGFGFTFTNDRYEKFPQIGSVEIGDDVEIGANTCVDRAALGVTRIGDGSKLDNLVHIAHNCQIGRSVVIAAQTGFSGGVIVGDYAVIGGQVGIGDKARIESRAVLGSQCGILPSRRVAAGEPLWGTPARPLRQHLKSLAYVNKIPELQRHVKELESELAAIRKISQTGAE